MVIFYEATNTNKMASIILADEDLTEPVFGDYIISTLNFNVTCYSFLKLL